MSTSLYAKCSQRTIFRHRRARLALLLVFCVAFIGLPAAASSSVPGQQADESPTTVVTEDDLLVQVADRVPAFGGAYLDGGVLKVWLTDPSEEPARLAQAALVELVSEDYATETFEILPASYTISDLQGWYSKLRDIHLVAPGFVFSSIDERTNRIKLAFENPDTARQPVVDELSRLGIPPEAVEIQQSAPIRLLQTIDDRHRPLIGGTQIQFQHGAFGLATATCTLGAVGVRTATGVDGFVTNSHCSRTQAEVDSGRYWQCCRPVFDTDQVGHETVDPPFFTGSPCPSGRRCRYSDANFVRLGDGIGKDQGRIAKPSGPNRTIEWTDGGKFRITTTASAVVGERLHKVGRTTGRTFGDVSDTCARVDVEGAGSDITMLCQGIVQGYSDLGDSGSPVFKVTNTLEQFDVTMKGLLWGGDFEHTIFAFSPWLRIEDEIGNIKVCGPAFAC